MRRLGLQVVVAYNPLAWFRNEYVTIPVRPLHSLHPTILSVRLSIFKSFFLSIHPSQKENALWGGRDEERETVQ